MKIRVLVFTSSLLLLLIGCTGDQAAQSETPSLSAVSLESGERLKVVATTSLVYDVVSNVGGDLIELRLLIPLGSDPHGYEATPQDAAVISQAHVVFSNGVGLEDFLEPLLENAGAKHKTVAVSEGIELLAREHSDHEEEEEHQHQSDADPHTWMDPNNVMVWVGNIEQALKTLDPDSAAQYTANARAYLAELEALDAWVREEIGRIPQQGRQVVTDHLLFAYFADEYGFEQVGAIVPGYSSMAEPSAKELAELQDTIREVGAKAIFVGHTVNPHLAQSVAEDTGTQLVTLYTGSLTDRDGDAPTYLDYMRYNVSAIVDALQ